MHRVIHTGIRNRAHCPSDFRSRYFFNKQPLVKTLWNLTGVINSKHSLCTSLASSALPRLVKRGSWLNFTEIFTSTWSDAHGVWSPNLIPVKAEYGRRAWAHFFLPFMASLISHQVHVWQASQVYCFFNSVFFLCLPSLMLYSCRKGTVFIYTVHFLRWWWDKFEVGTPKPV